MVAPDTAPASASRPVALSISGPFTVYDSARPKMTGKVMPTYRYVQDVKQVVQNCTLLSLPFEVKQMIWKYVCLLTTVRFIDRTKTSAEKGGLEFQLTCRMVYRETSNIMKTADLTSIHFTDLTLALNMLTTPRMMPMVAALRHLRLPLASVTIKPSAKAGRRSRAFPTALHFLPGLQLQNLLLDVCEDKFEELRGADAYRTMNTLVETSRGWRLLRFICNNDFAENWGFTGEVTWRRDKPQPKTWNDAIRKRDGVGSDACVTMHRECQLGADLGGGGCYKIRRHPGLSFEPYSQKPELIHSQYLDGGGNDRFLEKPKVMSIAEKKRMVVVLVKRRSGVDVQQRVDQPPYRTGHIRRWVGSRSWPEVCMGLHLEKKQ